MDVLSSIGSLIIPFFVVIIECIVYIFLFIMKNALLANFLLTSYYIGHEYCYNTKNISGIYSAIIGIIIALLVIFIIAKIKYIGLLVLMGFGTWWGYQLYIFCNEHIHIQNKPEISMILSIILGVVFFVYHIYSGIRYGRIFGEPYNPFYPILWLTKKIKNRIKDTLQPY